MHPDRIVIGSESNKAIEIMKEMYRVLKLNDIPFITTNLETAEMIKYASNVFLAMKIRYVNEIANLCEKVGADIQVVGSAMGGREGYALSFDIVNRDIGEVVSLKIPKP
ncbi:hypothetical protein ES705_23142 [subsurface metagenome]